ncbi:MAG TPA: CoA-transferase [Chloroflexia bacterium]|nr:CoA-transferase [Chloroflexia bacterium]
MPDQPDEQDKAQPEQPPQSKPITDRDLMGINFTMNIEPYPHPQPPAGPSVSGVYPPAGEEEETGRVSKELSLPEAIERFVPDGVESLAIGGMHMQNNPMALIRELVRQKKHIRRLITSPAGCINADLLIAAGLVEEVVTPYIGFEFLGLAPAFRRFAQQGRLKVYEIDELTLVLALRAGAASLPFAALPPGLELSDVVRANPAFYHTITDPFTGQEKLVTPALRPEVALVYASQADKQGNAVYKGAAFTDREMIMAARTVVLQVEQVLSSAMLTRNPQQVTVAGSMVDAVVEAPFGCHPTASHRFYHYDEDHLKEYIQAAATDEGISQYIEKYITNSADETEYLSKTEIAQG